jgi:hypothetical protein
MKRIALALAVVGAAVAVAIPLTTAGAQSSGPRTLNIVEREKGSQFGFVDNPPKIKNRRKPVVSPGDFFVFSTPLYDAANTTRVGKLHVQCVTTTRGRENQVEQLCTGVIKLNDGQLSLATVVKGDPKTVTGIITGGDGAYVGARGTFSSKDTKTGANDTISLLG